MDDLSKRNWDYSFGAIYSRSNLITFDHHEPPFLSTYSTGGPSSSRRIAFKCIKCEKLIPLSACQNCSSAEFRPGLNTQNVAGIFCFHCNQGFVTWECEECGTVNPVINSMVAEKKKCFIATAACGNENALEVKILQEFRIQYLERTLVGRFIIKRYYKYSPYLASKIRDRHHLSQIVRYALVRPIALFVNRKLRIR